MGSRFADIYASQLSHHGEGHPLWSPEPSKFGEVEIGDVGFIQDGAFFRLFNVTVAKNHPLNEHGVPDDFVKLELNSLLHNVIDHHLDEGPLSSRSVTTTSIRVGAGAEGGPNAGAIVSYEFQCTEEQGAMLILKDTARKEIMFNNNTWKKYIRVYHASWVRYARDVRDHDLQPEDIILVRGWIKTTKWTVAAFSASQTGRVVSAKGRIDPFASAGCELSFIGKTIMPARSRSGPRRSAVSCTQLPECATSGTGGSSGLDKFDQCVFLFYWKTKHRRFIPMRIYAAGEDDESYEDEDEDDHGSLTFDIEDESARKTDDVPPLPAPDPLSCVLDYILENSNAEVAIVKEDDAMEILKGDGYPADFSAYLRHKRPCVSVDENTRIGTLSSNAQGNMSITEWAAYGQNTLLISSFDCVMTSEKVINALARYGPIANLRLVPGKGYGIVNFVNEADAILAKDDICNSSGISIASSCGGIVNVCLGSTFVARLQAVSRGALVRQRYEWPLQGTIQRNRMDIERVRTHEKRLFNAETLSSLIAQQAKHITMLRSLLQNGKKPRDSATSATPSLCYSTTASSSPDVIDAGVLDSGIDYAGIFPRETPNFAHWEAFKAGALLAADEMKYLTGDLVLGTEDSATGTDSSIDSESESEDPLLSEDQGPAKIIKKVRFSKINAVAAPTSPQPTIINKDGYELARTWGGFQLDASVERPLVERCCLPAVGTIGIISPTEAENLFDIYWNYINPSVNLLDPALYSVQNTHWRSPFLFTVVCAIASRFYLERPQLSRQLRSSAEQAAATALISGKSVDDVYAFMLLSMYPVPVRKWEDDKSWIYLGVAIQLATNLNLEHPTMAVSKNEKLARETLNRTRAWLSCFNLDRSIGSQYGKPPIISNTDYVAHQAETWWNKSSYNLLDLDSHLAGQTACLTVLADFRACIYGNPRNPTGYNKHIDIASLACVMDNQLATLWQTWKAHILADSRLTVRRRTEHDRVQSAYQTGLLKLLFDYARMNILSFGFQYASELTSIYLNRPLLERCLCAAFHTLGDVLEYIGSPDKRMFFKYAPEACSVYPTFACAFIIKLLQPRYSAFITSALRIEICDKVKQIIELFECEEIAIDEHHWPKLYANFLRGLLPDPTAGGLESDL